MFALVGYPCIKDDFVNTLLDPKMIAWETAVSVAILVIGIIGLKVLFPHYPAAAYSLIGVGSVSTFIALLRFGVLKWFEASFRKGQEMW